MNSRPSFWNQSSELFMIAFATGIVFILFLPISSSILDFLLIINLSWALTILLLTVYTDKPLSFSTFPALLLISTLFRLALNISATRLILSTVQNQIENSNVDMVSTLMQLTMAQRVYQLNAKAVQIADELEKLTNELRD